MEEAIAKNPLNFSILPAEELKQIQDQNTKRGLDELQTYIVNVVHKGISIARNSGIGLDRFEIPTISPFKPQDIITEARQLLEPLGYVVEDSHGYDPDFKVAVVRWN